MYKIWGILIQWDYTAKRFASNKMNKCYTYDDQKKPDTKKNAMYSFIYIKLQTGKTLVLQV